MVISPIITRRTVKERAELLTAGERIEGKGVIFTGQLFLPRLPLHGNGTREVFDPLATSNCG